MQRAIALVRQLIDLVFPRGAFILSFLSLGYFAMGLIRNRVFASTFGAGAELDAYYAAFRIPEIALDVFVAAGLTAPFVPIYTALRRTGGEAADDFGRTVMTGAIGIMTVLSALIFLAAPALAGVFGNDEAGRGFDASTQALYVELLRINCLAQILFAASMTIGEILVAHRRFVFYALAPILYTTGIVLGTVLFGEQYGIHAAAWGAVAGAMAHLSIRVVGIRQTTFRIRFAFTIHTDPIREFVRLMIPRMVSHPIEPLTLTYFTLLAVQIGAGSVSSINFALDYQVVPILLIAIPFSLAIFPVLSVAYADQDLATFRRLLRRNLLTIGSLTALAGAGLFVLSGVVVEVLLGGGAFGPEDVARTSAVVAAFAISIPFDALAYPLSRGLYATHDTIRQVVASFVGLGVLVVVSQAIVPTAGILAIPLSYAAGMAVKDALLAVFLVGRLRHLAAVASARP